MRTPSEMSIGERIMLTIVIVLACFLVLALFGYVSSRWGDDAKAAPAPPELYAGIPFDAKLLELDRRALDESYHDQLKKLFLVWLSSQAGDPTQFSNGLRIARRAYNQAAQQISKREQQLEQERQQQREQR